MKNGLILALLMVAMVALVIPASAKAPVINQLPAVVVGDAGDISGTGTTAKHLLRYLNVFNLADATRITRFNNPTDPSKLKVFYTTSDATLKVSNATALVQPLTGAEVTALVGGTAPAGKQINTGTDFWLSLIEVAGAVPASAAAATPDANGSTEAELAAVVGGPKVVTLYAADADAITSSADVSAARSFDVYSVLNWADGFSIGQTPIYNADFEGDSDGWIFKAASSTSFSIPTQATNGSTGIGFQGLATLNGKIGYSTWESPLTAIPATGRAGKVIAVNAVMSGNAASSALTPGYRMIYLSRGVIHVGGAQVLTPTGGTQDNAPFTGQNRDFKLYWAVPTDLNGYGDGGPLTTVQAGNDLRDYYLNFDLIQVEDADAGTVIMDSINIGAMDRPADGAAAVKWGSGAGFTAFNDATNGWEADAKTVAGFDNANVAISATGVAWTMPATGTNGSGFKQAQPRAFGTLFPAWTSNKLQRISYRLTTANAAQVPTMRFLVLPLNSSSALVQAIVWGDVILTDTGQALFAPSAVGNTFPGAPKTSGSTFETYQYTHNAPTGADAATFHPSLDMAQSPATWPNNGWARPAAAYTVTQCVIEPSI